MIVVHSDNHSIKSFADLKGKKSSQSLTSNFAQLAKSSGAEVVATEGFNQSLNWCADRAGGCYPQRQPLLLDFKKQKPDAKLKVAATEAKGINRGPARQGTTRVAGRHQSGAAQCQAGWRISENIAEIFRHRRLAIISRQHNNN